MERISVVGGEGPGTYPGMSHYRYVIIGPHQLLKRLYVHMYVYLRVYVCVFVYGTLFVQTYI
jgi:hypothetical protein